MLQQIECLTLTADEVQAVLASMESNDHCSRAYHGEIVQVREKIEAVAWRGGLTMRRAPAIVRPSGLGGGF